MLELRLIYSKLFDIFTQIFYIFTTFFSHFFWKFRRNTISWVVVSTIAQWRSFCILALAYGENFLILWHCPFYRAKRCFSLQMREIAPRLLFRQPTGAPKFGFTGHHITSRNYRRRVITRRLGQVFINTTVSHDWMRSRNGNSATSVGEIKGREYKFFISNEKLVEHARFICGNHILDINKSILSTMAFKSLQSLLDQVSNVFAFLLTVIDSISWVEVHVLKSVKNRKDLAIVGDQSLANVIGRDYQVLKNFQNTRKWYKKFLSKLSIIIHFVQFSL